MSTSEESTSPSRGFPGLGPVLGLFGLYLLTVLGGVLLASPFEQAGVPTFENPESVTNVGLIFVEIVIFTGIFILILRYKRGLGLLRAIILTVFGYATYLAVAGAFTAVPMIEFIALALGVAVWLVLWFYPEWYVIDVTAVIAGAAIIAQLGNGLGPLPVLLFLVGMAAYDAYAVYVSEHMQTLGGGIGELRLPMVYIVPQSLPYSMDEMEDPFEEADSTTTQADTGTQDRPMLLGLGDAVVPGLLAVSGGQFLDAAPLVDGTILNAPAVGALVGSVVGLIGLLVLLYFVKRAHAGLPVLNTCVFFGYLGGAVSAGIPIAQALGL